MKNSAFKRRWSLILNAILSIILCWPCKRSLVWIKRNLIQFYNMLKKLILHEIQISFNSIPQIKQIRVNPYKSFSIANMLISINFCFSPYAMGSHNQLPHLHHHSPPSLQTHDSSSARYLWDPSAVAASNFHHPSAHG